MTLCPICVNEHTGEFGDEPHDALVGGVKFNPCKEHEDEITTQDFFFAKQRLMEAHEDCKHEVCVMLKEHSE
jgi:hypothetical protein